MFNSNKLFAFTLIALVAIANARPVDLPAGQDPSTATHSLNSPHTESIVPMTSSVIVNSSESLSAPSQVPTLTDHKDIPTTSAPVLPGTPSVATSTTLSTGAPAVPSAPVDPSIVHSDASAPDYVYCLVHCHPVAPKPSPDDVPKHTMTSGVVEPVPTPTSTDLHGTVSLPSTMSTSLSGLPTTTVVPELGAQTPAARVAETSAASLQVVETPALATPATTTLPTSAGAPSVSAPPSSAPSIGVPASSSSLPASVPVSAPSPPAMPSSVPTIPTDAASSPPTVPKTSASQ